MLALITKESEELRTVRFNPTEEDVPQDKLFAYVHLMPVEVQRIKEWELNEVQKILKRFI